MDALTGSSLPRHAESQLVEALEDTRVVILQGARQVGKSTLAEEVARRLAIPTVLTLDDATVRNAALADPVGFVGGLARPAVLDEVHRAPDVIYAVKAAVDEDRRPGQFLLTGSANIFTAPKIREALTGRIEAVRLWPLSQSEIERSTNNVIDALFASAPPQVTGAPLGREAFVDRAAAGGFPEPRLRVARRRARWFENYVQGVLQRDLRTISDIRRLDEMPRLLRVLASQSANILSTRKLASSLSIGHETVQAYIQLLETVFLVHRVPAWRPGLRAREVHAPKIYLVDTGLLCYLVAADERRVAEDPKITGMIFENFVAMEVLRHAEWSAVSTRQFHWREDDLEVDVVLESAAGDIVALEAKASATVDERDARALKLFRDQRGDAFKAGVVIYTGESTVPLSDRIWAVPVSGLWSG